MLPEGQSVRGITATERKSRSSSILGSCHGRFSAQKAPAPILVGSGERHRLSSSPDSRIKRSTAAFSAFANDRLSSCGGPPRLQWRYRSGFTPDSLLGPAACYRRWVLKLLFTFQRQYSTDIAKSQSDFQKWDCFFETYVIRCKKWRKPHILQL